MSVESFGARIVQKAKAFGDKIFLGDLLDMYDREQKEAEERAQKWGKKLPEFLAIGDTIYHSGSEELTIINKDQIAVLPKDPQKEVQVFPPVKS